jgi:hypothetical protein
MIKRCIPLLFSVLIVVCTVHGPGVRGTAEGDSENAGKTFPKWVDDPSDRIEQVAYQLSSDAPNVVGDRVIYYVDMDGNGQYDKGEFIFHSAIVVEVDSEGYTTLVKAKLGQYGIYANHPAAPGYYDRAIVPYGYKDKSGRISMRWIDLGSTKRAYFRMKKEGK